MDKTRELFEEVPGNLAVIITKITENCFEKTSADLVLSNLQNIKFNRSDIQKFTKEVEDILSHSIIILSCFCYVTLADWLLST